MIQCHFDTNSYYILGKDIEIFSSVINPETDSIRRAYWILIMLLPELSLEKDNIIFYNDSRVVDDMNGIIVSMDDWTREAKRISKQMILSFNGLALFRKKSPEQIKKTLDIARSTLIDPKGKYRVAASVEASWNKKHIDRVRKLKNIFFGGRYE